MFHVKHSVIIFKIKVMEDLRLNATALYLGVSISELEVSSYDDKIIEYGSEEYLVVTDDEADELWENELDNYLEEIIYPELPEHICRYFDSEAWKSDARYDGRASSLGRYDGNEDSVIYEDIELYIYRQN